MAQTCKNVMTFSESGALQTTSQALKQTSVKCWSNMLDVKSSNDKYMHKT